MAMTEELGALAFGAPKMRIEIRVTILGQGS
jgi:hypothetical protein